MSDPIRVVMLVGGATVHPIAQQAGAVVGWLSGRYGDRIQARLLDGVTAFEELDACDLLVLMGLHFTKMTTVDWAGQRPYRAADAGHRLAFERYVRSGRPVLAHHSAIGSYDDWPGYGRLLGVRWDWDASSHEDVARQRIRVRRSGHSVVAGLADFEIVDEAYENVWISPDFGFTVHAEAILPGGTEPMVITGEGGRVPGAGRVAYIALGHGLRAFRTASYQRVFMNVVEWLLDTRASAPQAKRAIRRPPRR